jgi:hypothetical protein
MRRYGAGVVAGLAVFVVTLLSPVVAQAVVRYAEPAGGATSGQCPQSNPCTIVFAVETAAQPNDEVVVMPGTYVLSDELEVSDSGLDLHGQAGELRPLIASSALQHGLDVTQPATVRDLRVSFNGAVAGVNLEASTGQALGERLIVHASGGLAACRLGDGAIRDSVCRSTNPGTDGLVMTGSGSSNDFEATATNVTAHTSPSPGSGTYGVFLHAAGDPGDSAALLLLGKNVIASGGDADVRVETAGSASPSAAAFLINSNFATSTSAGPGMEIPALPGENDNQTAEPVFANAPAGDFHQVFGSPTINAGIGGLGLGTLDFDGQARVQGPAPDIGADEFPQASPPGGGGDDDPPETTIDKGPKRKTKKRKAKFEFSSDEPGSSFECKLDKKGFEACDSSERFKVKRKRHRLEVRAIDPAGNADPTPDSHAWKVKKKKKGRNR